MWQWKDATECPIKILWTGTWVGFKKIKPFRGKDVSSTMTTSAGRRQRQKRSRRRSLKGSDAVHRLQGGVTMFILHQVPKHTCSPFPSSVMHHACIHRDYSSSFPDGCFACRAPSKDGNRIVGRAIFRWCMVLRSRPVYLSAWFKPIVEVGEQRLPLSLCLKVGRQIKQAGPLWLILRGSKAAGRDEVGEFKLHSWPVGGQTEWLHLNTAYAYPKWWSTW